MPEAGGQKLSSTSGIRHLVSGIYLCPVLPALNFPAFILRTRTQEGKPQVFDPVRKRWVALSPEEWVRQHALHLLIDVKSCPASLLAVEKLLRVNGLAKRTDIVVYGSDHQPKLIVECKAPGVRITQQVFDQAARYNLALGADVFWLTNGLKHFCCRADHDQQSYHFLKDIPEYSALK